MRNREEIEKALQEGQKVCLGCDVILPLESFQPDKRCGDGFSNFCKECFKIQRKKWYHTYKRTDKGKAWTLKNNQQSRKTLKVIRETFPEKLLFTSAKARAKKKSVPFSITTKDIFIPKYCPILGIELKMGTHKIKEHSPSLDRIFPELGYVPGNIAVISWRANQIKNCGTIEEHRKIADWMEEYRKGGK